jgi:hypothetical protein
MRFASTGHAQECAKCKGKEWIPATLSTMPEKGKKVIVRFENSIGKERKTIAMWCPAFYLEASEEDEDPDYDADENAFSKQGWYEEMECAEYVYLVPYDITHWMPLPDSPEKKQMYVGAGLVTFGDATRHEKRSPGMTDVGNDWQDNECHNHKTGADSFTASVEWGDMPDAENRPKES